MMLKYYGHWYRGVDGNRVYGNKAYSYSPKELYETALHEAVHALWDAHHSDDGLMCSDDCTVTGTVRWGGFIRSLGMRPLDAQVYALYGDPRLEHGMSRDDVAALIVTR